MQYEEEMINKIVQLGTLGYPLSKIINVLDMEKKDIKQFTDDFYNKNTKIYSAYKKGIDKADFIIDYKLFEMAKNGDLKALEKYNKRKIDNMYDARQEEKKHKN